MAKIAINGLGRIGRAALKILLDTPQLQLVAANDIGSLENIAYLLKYDTIYGKYGKAVTTHEGNLVIDGQPIRFFNEKDPAQLPGASWASTSCWNVRATSPSGRISPGTSRPGPRT
jgi:glyceraldehyde 3-phosphate dehydrogenase